MPQVPAGRVSHGLRIVVMAPAGHGAPLRSRQLSARIISFFQPKILEPNQEKPKKSRHESLTAKQPGISSACHLQRNEPSAILTNSNTTKSTEISETYHYATCKNHGRRRWQRRRYHCELVRRRRAGRHC